MLLKNFQLVSHTPDSFYLQGAFYGFQPPAQKMNIIVKAFLPPHLSQVPRLL